MTDVYRYTRYSLGLAFHDDCLDYLLNVSTTPHITHVPHRRSENVIDVHRKHNRFARVVQEGGRTIHGHVQKEGLSALVRKDLGRADILQKVGKKKEMNTLDCTMYNSVEKVEVVEEEQV